MASRRCLAAAAAAAAGLRGRFSTTTVVGATRCFSRFLSFHSSNASSHLSAQCYHSVLRTISIRHFSPRSTKSSDSEDEDEDEDDEEWDETDGEEEDNEICDDDNVPRLKCVVKSEEEKIQEADKIGYKVVGPLDQSERPFKPYEPVFAVVQVGSHQFKVSNGDSIFTEKLKYCDVNDKLILNKVLMLGSRTQTIFGRPILPNAAVHAVVEEHALDAKVIIFKKKRRKNYRRTKGHRQELTKLRITDIQGIDKSDNIAVPA